MAQRYSTAATQAYFQLKECPCTVSGWSLNPPDVNYTEDSSRRLKCFCLKENAVPLDTVLWLLPDQLHFPGLIHISSGQNVRYTLFWITNLLRFIHWFWAIYFAYSQVKAGNYGNPTLAISCLPVFWVRFLKTGEQIDYCTWQVLHIHTPLLWRAAERIGGPRANLKK